MWFVGDDWAEDHHDVEVQDGTGRRLARARLPEGVAGIARLHELIAGVVAEDAEPGQVALGIETDRGPWVAALVAAGYRVFAINPRQVARYRERHGTSGAKSDAADAHTLADMVRTDAHQLRPVAGDSALAEGVKVLTRAHQNLIWDRHRQMLRLRAALREFFPAALEAFPDLTAPDALELLAAAPDPDRAARLSRSKIAAALRRARRRDVEAKAVEVQSRGSPGRVALGAADPAGGAGRRLRRDRARERGADRRDQHSDHRSREAGRGPFWPAPGR
jgi:Transposase